MSWQQTTGGFTGLYETSTPFGVGLTNSATWSTTVLPSDTLGVNDQGLEVSATWKAAAANSSYAQYFIYVNGNLVYTASVNQQQSPTGTTETLNSRTGTFQELAALSNLQVGDTITVVLQGPKVNGNLVADTIGLGPDDASGGGISNQPQPSYQTGLVIHDGNSILFSTGLRAYPDVAFDGDYVNSPVLIVNQGLVQEVAGTSLGAPTWAGLIAIADQGLATVGHAPLNTAQALAGLYSLPSRDFHDETTGYNGYSAGPGYDLGTGLGSPVANQLIIDLDRTVAPVSGPLVYEAPEGQRANNIQLIQNGATLEVLNNSTIGASAPRAETTSIDIIGAHNQLNTLTLNFGPINNPNQAPAAPTGIPISFDGGSPGGSLVLQGGSFTNEENLANDAHSGSLYLNNTPITYTDLASIVDTATATNLTIADPLGKDVVTVGDDPNSPEYGVATSQVSGSGFATVDLANKTHVLFDDYSLVGSDTVNVLAPLVNGATFTFQQIPNFTDGPAIATATVGTPYSFTYTAQGTPGPTFRLVSGSQLPPGLSLSANGVLSGTPTAIGTFTGGVDVNNGVGVGAIQNYSIAVGKAEPFIDVIAGPTVFRGSGAKLTASAILGGGYFETGTITFTLYAPTGVVADTETVAVNGNGTYQTPNGFLPTVSSPNGTYHWVVSYSGDADNNAASTAKNQLVVGPGITIVGSVLYLVGGPAIDRVGIVPVGTSLTGSTGIKVVAQLDNVDFQKTFTQHFTGICVVGFGGNDIIEFANTLTIAAIISEGDGNNHLSLGDGNYSVTLGNGNNVIKAGTGNVNIQAGDGTDSVTAGTAFSNGAIRIQLGNGNNDQVTLLGNGNETVQVGNGLDDSVSIKGNGNEIVQTGLGTGTLHITGTGRRMLKLGQGWAIV